MKTRNALIPSLENKQTICSRRKTGGTGVSPVCGSTVALAMPSAQTGGTPDPPARCEVQLFPGVGMTRSEFHPVSTFGTAAQGRLGQRLLRACKASFFVCMLCWCLPALLQAGADITPPLLVWDISFNEQSLNMTPQPMSKEQIERQQKDLLASLPIKTYAKIEYLTATRRAIVKKEAAGLSDKPVLFVYEDAKQPHYGPEMRCEVPPELATIGKLWRLSFDVSKGSVGKSGGINVWDVAWITFSELGEVRAEHVEIARYAPNKPIHIECVIDVVKKSATITVNGKSESSSTIPWARPLAANFRVVIFSGNPAEAPGSIAFDNIRLVMEE